MQLDAIREEFVTRVLDPLLVVWFDEAKRSGLVPNDTPTIYRWGWDSPTDPPVDTPIIVKGANDAP